MTKLEKLYSIIENSREVGVKLSCLKTDTKGAIIAMQMVWSRSIIGS